MSRRAAAPTIPHIDSGLFFRRFPRRNGNLPRPRHGQLARGRVLVDGRARADVRAARNAHRCDQGRVRADEAFVFDDRTVLRRSVVVASDGTGADVDARANLAVAEIAEVVRLRPCAQAARFYLDEVADVYLLGELRAGPQPCVRPEAAALADARILQVAKRVHFRAGGHGHVPQHAVRADAHTVAERYAALEHAVDVDRDVAPAFERAAHVEARRVGQGNAGFQQVAGNDLPVLPLERGELGLGVDSRRFPGVLGLDRDHRDALADRESDEIGEVV